VLLRGGRETKRLELEPESSRELELELGQEPKRLELAPESSRELEPVTKRLELVLVR
jgi:hypothetical protein